MAIKETVAWLGVYDPLNLLPRGRLAYISIGVWIGPCWTVGVLCLFFYTFVFFIFFYSYFSKLQFLALMLNVYVLTDCFERVW